MRYIALLLALFTLATPTLAVDLYNSTINGPNAGQNLTYDSYYLAQSINVGASTQPMKITDFSIGLYKDASLPSATYFVQLQGDSGGSPDGNTLATLQGGAFNSITANTATAYNGYTGVDQTYTNGFVLQPGVDYWVVVGTTGTTQPIESMAILTSTSDVIPNSVQKLNIGGTWYDQNGDFSMVVQATAVPEPSTYVSGLLGVCAMVLAYRHKRAKACAS
jgi:hypothetical protein